MVRDRMLFDEGSAAARYRWEPGGRRSSQGGQLLALSPAPVATGERAVDATNWIRRKTNGWLDLQGGNWLFGAEFALMFLSLRVLTVFTALALEESGGLVLPALPGPRHHRAPDKDAGTSEFAGGA